MPHILLQKIRERLCKKTKPLYGLTRMNVPWNWTEQCEKAFLNLKGNLTRAPILAYPNANGSEFILDTDASSYAIGGVLSKVQ